MALNPGGNPLAVFLGLDGRPLNGGKVYIGVAGQNPVTNPQDVFWDEDGNTPASQPLGTLSGYVVNNGSPSRFWTQNNAFSITVLDRADQQVFYAANVAFALPDGVVTADSLTNDPDELTAIREKIGVIRFSSVPGLIEDESLSYTDGEGQVAVEEGSYVEAAAFGYEVAASGATDHHVETDGGVKLYVLPDSDGLYNVAAFGALPGSDIDNTPLIQKAIDTGPAKVPAGAWPGVWRCDEMIEIGSNQSLYLETGVRLQRQSATSSDTNPVVWLNASNARLSGPGMRVSSVHSQNRAPKGVVRVGHEDMENSHATVSFCKVSGIEIIGQAVGGQTAGDPDICLFIPNAQLGGNANYYHTLDDLLLTQANFGLNLRGWANGNMMSNIHGRQLGNVTLGDGGLLWVQGALDNTLNGMQFHASPDSSGIILDDYDNTGVSGGVYHTGQMNYFGGIVCEQGGSNARGVKSYNAKTTQITIISNVNGGNLLHSTWNADFNLLFDTVRNTTGRSNGAGWDKTYQATGPITVRVAPQTALNGSANFSGTLWMIWDGMEANGTGRESAGYLVPFSGSSTYTIGTPENKWPDGDDLTITQIANGNNFVTFTVTGASATTRNSLRVEAQGYPGVKID